MAFNFESELIKYSDNYTLCKHCKKPAYERCFTEAGRKEVGISGLCEICFDIITAEPLTEEQERRLNLILDKPATVAGLSAEALKGYGGQVIVVSPEESEFLSAVEYTRDEIAAAFCVDPADLGIEEL
jgi:hypothetical protein